MGAQGPLPGQPGGPPPGAGPGPQGPQGPMGPVGQMYGNNMMSDVRMRAQSRYRLGNPSASSMRQPMQVPPGAQGPNGPIGPGGPGGPNPPGAGPPPPGSMTVPPGQQSPMGNPGNMPMMPNPNMRPQVCTLSYSKGDIESQCNITFSIQMKGLITNMMFSIPDAS